MEIMWLIKLGNLVIAALYVKTIHRKYSSVQNHPIYSIIIVKRPSIILSIEITVFV